VAPKPARHLVSVPCGQQGQAEPKGQAVEREPAQPERAPKL
jgi:hypothetical protein